MLSKINITSIILDQFKTLRKTNSDEISWSDLFLMIGLPFLLAGIGVSFFDAPNHREIGSYLTGVAVVVGLLLNLQVLIFTLISKVDKSSSVTQEKIELRSSLLAETSTNISFGVLSGITLILLLIVTPHLNHQVQILSHFAVLFLAWISLFCVLMIVKRMHILLREEIALRL